MKLVESNVSNFVRVTLACVLGSALLSLPAPSKAASKTLTMTGTPATTVAVGGSYSFQPTGKDTVKSRLKYDIYNKPEWAQFDGLTGRLSGRPNRRQVGTYKDISIRFTDWYGFVSTPMFSITVTPAVPVAPVPPANTAPTISGHAAAAVNVGMAYGFTPTTADANKDELSFSIRNLPDWAKFNTASGALSGTPTAGDVGTYANIQISVNDGKAGAVLPAFTIAVNQMSAGNTTLDWMPPTENTDGSVLTNLAGYKVHYGMSPGQLTQVDKLTNPGLTSYVVDNLSAGIWYFSVSSYSTNGTESSSSGTVWTVIL
jgi:Putative Ig domain